MALILLLFIFLLIFGTPIVFSLGVAASFTLVAYDVPLALVAQNIRCLDNYCYGYTIFHFNRNNYGKRWYRQENN